MNTDKNKAKKEKVGYVIVHPDDFALKVSGHIEHPILYKRKLGAKVKSLLKKNAVVMLLNLTHGENFCPNFLLDVVDQIEVIPSLEDDPTEAQADRLKVVIGKHWPLSRLIFAGGWKNACLKHTINHTISGVERIRFVEKISSPFTANVQINNTSYPILVEVDQEFVF